MNIAEEIDLLKMNSSIKENLKKILPNLSRLSQQEILKILPNLSRSFQQEILMILPNFSQSSQQKILEKIISLINSKEKEPHRKNIQELEFINELSIAGYFINRDKLSLEYEKKFFVKVEKKEGLLTPDFVDENTKTIIECFTVNLDNKTDKEIYNTKSLDKNSVANGNIDESICCYCPDSTSLVQKMLDRICDKIKKYQNIDGYRLIIAPYASFSSSLGLEDLSPDKCRIYYSDSRVEGIGVIQGENFQDIIKKRLDEEKLRSSKLQIYFFESYKKVNLIYQS